MPSVKGSVTVITPVGNSLCSAFNSYEVDFNGPQRMFDNELWTTRSIGGTLQRVCNPDGTWTERIFFSTGATANGFAIGGTPGQPQMTTLTQDVVGSGVGTVPATVVGLQGQPINPVAPTTNQVLMWSGTHWTPSTISTPPTPSTGAPPVTGGGGAPVTGGGGAPETGGGTGPVSPVSTGALLSQIAELEARIAVLEGKK